MITIHTDKKIWKDILLSFDSYDFYHTYDYHDISKNKEDKAVLVTYSNNDTMIAIPLLIRKIPNTDYFDATSVYGYAGPIHKNISKSFDNSDFSLQLNAFFKSQKIISIFSRLNPFVVNQENTIKNIGQTEDLGDIVFIDLTLDLDIQRSNYHKTIRKQVNRLRRTCVVKKAVSKAEIDTFIAMYYENMKRVNASSKYFFDKEYFYSLLDSTDFYCELLLVIHNETNSIIAGSIFAGSDHVIHHHLSANNQDFIKLSPTTLLNDEIRIKSSKEGYLEYNLGGGLKAERDSLFNYKSYFSKDLKSFKIWKYIVDNDIYVDLVKKNNIKGGDNFFPLYRFNE